MGKKSDIKNEIDNENSGVVTSDRGQEKPQKGKKLRTGILIALIAVLVLFFVPPLFFDFEDEEPDEEPVTDVKPGDITIQNIIENNITIINVGGVDIELTEATEKDEAKIDDNKDDVIIKGKTKEGNSFKAAGSDLIVSSGNKKVKAAVKSENANFDAAKIAAAVSASISPKENSEKDFSLEQSFYLYEPADCTVFYPSQMRLLGEKDGILSFFDTKTESELYVRFTKLKDIASGEAKPGIATPPSFRGKKSYGFYTTHDEGNGYFAETGLYFPDKYSYAYDVLAGLVQTVFQEQDIFSYAHTIEYGPNTEMKCVYYPDFECNVIIPIEFEEEAIFENVVYFRDYIKDHAMTLTFSELPPGVDTNNIFEIFDVYADDYALWMTEHSVTWHNDSGIHIGAASNYYTAIMEIEGADSWDSYSDSLEKWAINFSDQSMYSSIADDLREDLISELAQEIIRQFFEVLAQSDPGDVGEINEGDPGDVGEINEGDPGDIGEIDEGDPGDTMIYISYIDRMKADPESLYGKLPFTNMDSDISILHDVWDGDIGQVCYYTDDSTMKQFLANVDSLTKNGFGIMYRDKDLWDNDVLLLVNDENEAVWVRYGNGAEIIFFKKDYSLLQGRSADKIYISYSMKKKFLDSILPNTYEMVEFLCDIENAYNSLQYYWVDCQNMESDFYFYEFDLRQDGGFQIDVYRTDEDLSHVGTYVHVDYKLYKVEAGNKMILLR